MTPAFILQTASQPNPILSVLPLVAMFGIMYFLLVLPMQRQRKKQKEMLESLKSGDIVTTTGGIVGSIISMTPETVILRVKPDNVKLQFARSAISGVAETQEIK